MHTELIIDGPFEFAPPRSPGIHQSDILHRLCLARGIYKDDDDPDRVKWDLGLAHERAIVQLQMEKDPAFFKTGEIEVDGIKLNIDLIRQESWGIEPWEIKLTAASSMNGPGSQLFWRFESQLMTYCYGVNCKTGVLDVTFEDGDFSYPREAIRRAWRYHFTRHDLIENWIMYRSMLSIMIREKKG